MREVEPQDRGAVQQFGRKPAGYRTETIFLLQLHGMQLTAGVLGSGSLGLHMQH